MSEKAERVRRKTSRRIIYIWCRSEETYRVFRRFAADYRNYEEALRALLRAAGLLRETPVF